ncbi:MULTISPECIES: DUF6197 family protein [unclassified Streptomyces]|uniref:DUF6197 family protein n=1 Tax=unclassified Streptomyces TaxID=2593676 RepID=UPI00226FF252|nr:MULTISPECIES: hypothetical protein [unclassified Streptomyces]MCY0921874.1 hypothetical protein [Streptomyces sp. H27-G5]MCY0957177.1 hypothetical protein [Streptomyces sp. H27-H5]
MNPTLPTIPPDDAPVVKLPAALRVQELGHIAATVEETVRTAAWILRTRGHWQHGSVPDAADREMCIPHALRPMSITAAIKCATTGDPRDTCVLADNVIVILATSLGGALSRGGIFDLEEHIDAWGDMPARSTDDAVELLERLAATLERAA